ncbi:hypothetical protein T439DRAFT_325579 [Meredithblackwellia eburnea MCA 4105]
MATSNPSTKSHPADLPPSSPGANNNNDNNEELDPDQLQSVVAEGEGEGEEMDEEELLVVDHDEEEEEQDDDEEELEGVGEGEGEGYGSSSTASSSTSTLTWISWFCALPGHEYFCEVAEDFIEDDFNLTGLNTMVPFYKEAMEMVLDVEAEDEGHRVPDVTIVESSAELLYGLIHQRFIITRVGVQQMFAKYESSHFGVCPRVYCSQQKLVPCGRSDLPGVDTVKLYCPSCVDMYVPPSSRFLGVDGAFFGTTFPHLLFQTYPTALPFQPQPQPTEKESKDREATTPLTSLSKIYVPRIYGFKVSERARSGPRMQWLRMRPRTEAELLWTSDTEDDASSSKDKSHPQASSGEKGAFDEGFGSGDDDDEEEEEEAAEEAAGRGKAMEGVVGTPPVVGKGESLAAAAAAGSRKDKKK